MKLLVLFLNKVYAVGYIPQSSSFNKVALPTIPYLGFFELLLWIILLLILLRPFLNEQINPILETKRKHSLKLAFFIGTFALIIHIYRFLYIS